MATQKRMMGYLAAYFLMIGCSEKASNPPYTDNSGSDGLDGFNGIDGAPGPQGAPGADAVQGGSRLTPECLTADDGARVCTGRFYDSVLGDYCRFIEVGGAYQCRPESFIYSYGEYFSDSICQSSADLIGVVSDCVSYPRFISVGEPTSGCFSNVVYRVDGSCLAQAYILSNGVCVPYHTDLHCIVRRGVEIDMVGAE